MSGDKKTMAAVPWSGGHMCLIRDRWNIYADQMDEYSKDIACNWFSRRWKSDVASEGTTESARICYRPFRMQ